MTPLWSSCSAQPEVKNVAVSTRTNLRQQLMKQQLAEQDKRFQQVKAEHLNALHVSDAVSMPNSDANASTEVPAQILEVRTNVVGSMASLHWNM